MHLKCDLYSIFFKARTLKLRGLFAFIKWLNAWARLCVCVCVWVRLCACVCINVKYCHNTDRHKIHEDVCNLCLNAEISPRVGLPTVFARRCPEGVFVATRWQLWHCLFVSEISAEKTELMTNNTSGISTEIKLNGQKLETVTSFKYLGSVITDYGSKPEILSRTAQTTAALTRLRPVWNNKSICFRPKIRLMRSLVTSVFLYAC